MLTISFAAACTPAIPFHFTETPEALGKKEVSVQLAFGGGGAGKLGHNGNSADGFGGVAGAARVRVGVDARQEVGAEVVGVAAGLLGGWAVMAKATWKISLRPWLALLAGLGVSAGPQPWYAYAVDEKSCEHYGCNVAVGLGGDAGILFALTRANRSPWHAYAGLRLSVAGPIYSTSSFGSQNGLTMQAIAPVGVARDLGARWRLFLEAGLFAVKVERSNMESPTLMGAYLAIAMDMRFPRRR